MSPSIVLDLALILVLVAGLASGLRSGFARSLGGIIGALAGVIAAVISVPWVVTVVPDPAWRTPAALVTALVLVTLGLTLGTAAGLAVRRRLEKSRLGPIDRVLGGALTLVATAAVIAITALTVASLGIPSLTPVIAQSTVIRTIDSLTPAPARDVLARARSFAVDDGLPSLIGAFTGTAPDLPAAPLETPELAAAAQSVVRITGVAYSCGQNQSGSGFVAADERVITNAHVVAGVVAPIVQSPAGQALEGRVVYFDPVDDLAVIEVPGLSAAPIGMSPDLAPQTDAVVQGYPFGGPYDADPAVVIALGTQLVADIYGDSPAPRQVYTIASDVQPGESGGPLLSAAGEVAGVVFARAADVDSVGYALGRAELDPVVAGAAALVEPVSSGGCAGS